MIKWLILIGIYMFSLTAKAQVTYEFDKVLQYDFQRAEGDSIQRVYYLVNSKGEKYHARFITEGKTVNMRFIEFDGIIADVKLPASQFFNTDSLSIPCSLLKRLSYASSNRSFVKKHTIASLSVDSEIGAAYHHFAIQNKKNPVRHNSLHFFMDTSFNVYPSFDHNSIYALNQKNNGVINGVIKEKYHLDLEEKENYIYKLTNITDRNLRILIPEECGSRNK